MNKTYIYTISKRGKEISVVLPMNTIPSRELVKKMWMKLEKIIKTNEHSKGFQIIDIRNI